MENTYRNLTFFNFKICAGIVRLIKLFNLAIKTMDPFRKVRKLICHECTKVLRDEDQLINLCAPWCLGAFVAEKGYSELTRNLTYNYLTKTLNTWFKTASPD